MKLFLTYIANVLLLVVPTTSFGQTKLEIHGHRGFRGLFPENSITGFKEAVKCGADFIELDVIISKDSQVVVSHEPWFSPDYCSSPDGQPVTKRSKGNLHKMLYAEIKKFDTGKRGNKKFPDQAKIATCKPLLREVILELENYCQENNLPPIRYNIEIKNGRFGDRNYHFDTKTTTRLIAAVIKPFNINDRILIQSFDRRCLREMRKIQPAYKTGLLVANLRSVRHNIHKLGFTPDYYNPAFQVCRKKTVDQAHARDCKVVVWTVNDDSDFKRLGALGADGIITDFPNLK